MSPKVPLTRSNSVYRAAYALSIDYVFTGIDPRCIWGWLMRGWHVVRVQRFHFMWVRSTINWKTLYASAYVSSGHTFVMRFFGEKWLRLWAERLTKSHKMRLHDAFASNGWLVHVRCRRAAVKRWHFIGDETSVNAMMRRNERRRKTQTHWTAIKTNGTPREHSD